MVTGIIMGDFKSKLDHSYVSIFQIFAEKTPAKKTTKQQANKAATPMAMAPSKNLIWII